MGNHYIKFPDFVSVIPYFKNEDIFLIGRKVIRQSSQIFKQSEKIERLHFQN